MPNPEPMLHIKRNKSLLFIVVNCVMELIKVSTSKGLATKVHDWDCGSNWVTRFWITTHVDLHRTAKVQAFLKVLRTSLSEQVGRSDAAVVEDENRADA